MFAVVPNVKHDRYYGRGTTYTFEAHAVPMTYGSTGKRSFSVTDSWELRGADRRGRQLEGDGELIR